MAIHKLQIGALVSMLPRQSSQVVITLRLARTVGPKSPACQLIRSFDQLKICTTKIQIAAKVGLALLDHFMAMCGEPSLWPL